MGDEAANIASDVEKTQPQLPKPADKEVPAKPEGIQAPASSTPAASEKDYEQGLRIINRCFTAAEVAAQFKDARVLRFTRVQELRQRADCNRIIVGVLYDFVTGKLGNGELYTRWSLTDMAEPEPRRLIVQLHGRAYEHWRKPVATKSATRASIFAILNPRNPIAAEKSEWSVRVENPSQLAKLGECPSLGLCDMKGCRLPCNVDLKDRFCKMHLGLAYANKGGRILTGGNSSAHLLNTKRHRRMQAQEDEEEPDPELVEKAKRLKTAVAMQLDERRFSTSEANDNYFRSIKAGNKADMHHTSRVPVLGRAMEEDVELELDIATIDTSEKIKADRMIERIIDIRAERHLADSRSNSASSSSSPQLNLDATWNHTSPKTSQSSGESRAKPQKKSLNDLMELLKGRRTARRAGVKDAGDEKREGGKTPCETPADVAATTAPATTAPNHPAPANDTSPGSGLTVSMLASELEKAGDDLAQIKAVFSVADGLPVSELEGAEGGRFYAAVGKLVMHENRVDIRRAALLARRRWRSASHDSKETAAGKVSQTAEQLPMESTISPPGNAEAPEVDTMSLLGIEQDSTIEDTQQAETVLTRVEENSVCAGDTDVSRVVSADEVREAVEGTAIAGADSAAAEDGTGELHTMKLAPKVVMEDAPQASAAETLPLEVESGVPSGGQGGA
jgi:hypothetical protein